MWNRFLTGFDSPAELFVNLWKEHVDYDGDLADYQANADDDFYWTSLDKKDVDYTIEYNEDDNKGHLTPNPEPYTPEDNIPEPLRFRNDWIDLPCELPSCTVCNEEWDTCDPWVVCEGKKHYVPFCEPPTEFECDELPDCVDCEDDEEECQRVFGCEREGHWEAWI